MRNYYLLAAVACGLLASASAPAAVVLRLEAVGPTTIASGSTVELKLFLDDDTGALNDEGLISGGARLLSADTGTASIALNSVIINAGFDDLVIPPAIYPAPDAFPAGAPTGFQNVGGFLAAVDFFSQPLGQLTDSVDLVHFFVKISGTPGDTAIFVPSPVDELPAAYILGSLGTEFEALISDRLGVTITISGPTDPGSGEVPEPTSLISMLGLASIVGMSAYRRRAAVRT